MKKKSSKKEKVLLTLYKTTKGKKKSVHYEDLLVETFKVYPKDFQLKRYPEYPDSDIFRYIIYFQLKPAGLIRIVNKECIITNLGIKLAKNLCNDVNFNESIKNFTNETIERLLKLKGFLLFIEGRLKEIIDQDFYEFFKSSVRTRPLELLGNINQIEQSILDYNSYDYNTSRLLMEYSDFLKSKFLSLCKGIKNENDS